MTSSEIMDVYTLTRWEYQQATVNSGQNIAGALSALGAAGWEAVGMQAQAGGGTIVLLKRPQ